MADRHANKTKGIRMQVGTLRPSPGKTKDPGSIVLELGFRGTGCLEQSSLGVLALEDK